ncbi:MAG: hypothetical protein HFI81_09300 [Eubacterium sp.]|jgi:flagellar hook-length control protein FliK|nr:hypothetical protein [Eubacterium sp.]
MGTDISGIAKNILEVRANLKAESVKKGVEPDVKNSFMEMMGQSQFSSNVHVSSNVKQIASVTEKSDTATAAYDTYRDPAKNVQTVSEKSPEEVLEEASEPLEAYEEEIRDILKEEFGVTDEEIDAALESLGLTLLDVRNPQDLAALAQALTGEDVGTLFVSEAFQAVMQQVSAVTETFCEELGISKEDWNTLCEAFEQMKAPETLNPEDISLPEGGEESLEQPTTEQTVPEAVQDQTQTDETVTQEKTQPKEALPKEQIEAVAQKEEEPNAQKPSELKQTEVEAGKNAIEQTADVTEEETGADSNAQSFTDHSKDAKPNMAHINVSFAEQQMARMEEAVLPQDAVPNYSSQLDAFELIEQIAKNVRVTFTAETTSMEMQLNPANLGKIYLNITEKEGAVRAQIAAQNETVKEALETQAVELRQSLHQQGIKVDAIEVTVATHEFEQNLEQNAKQDEQMQKQQEEARPQMRRNLTLNDLDGLTGLMTEEEQLAARIMQENGNQVDLTA